MCKQIKVNHHQYQDQRKVRKTLRKLIALNRISVKHGEGRPQYHATITHFTRRKHVTGCKLF